MDVTLVIYDVFVPCRRTPGGSAGRSECSESFCLERFSGEPIKRDRQIMSVIRLGANGWFPVG